MRFNNPFVFLVQITLDVLLLPVSDNESSLGKNAASCGQYLTLNTGTAAHDSPSSSGGIASSVTDSDNFIYELERGYLLPTEQTPSSVTSTFEATKRRSELHFDIGRGSIFGMRFNNPFVFLVQTPSERYDVETGLRPLGRIFGVIGCVNETMIAIVGPSKNDATAMKAVHFAGSISTPST
ncbi:hypothetical protein HPB47_004703 [Ixodes persulcatus]|uniref:Uncharacterized protein n=1 Tax=Ixodes persulcatus TaxID=34615 RepID=A0AC60PF42_IXOPE|nr:hypothetical protein HPB47_004703 [Ixodes persulcatus]